MPADALPQPWPEQSRTGSNYRREYRDVLGRPMSGSVTITGTARNDDGGTVTVPSPVVVELDAGVLDVHLPADTYTVVAQLATVDKSRVTDNDTVTIGA